MFSAWGFAAVKFDMFVLLLTSIWNTKTVISESNSIFVFLNQNVYVEYQNFDQWVDNRAFSLI